jgi:hydroxymethylbilane synthase
MTSLRHRFPLKLGTRASALAMAQAQETQRKLCAYLGAEVGDIVLVPMTTSGDKHLEGTLTEIGGKGLFTKELEDSLLSGRIDLAVHSLKDMATVMPPRLIIAATFEREDVRDALISNHPGGLEGLPQGAVFGTASLRRAAQVKQVRPDLEIFPLRGNVPTRLSKLRRGEVDATLLAVAGLKRLNLWEESGAVALSAHEFIPAVGQGAIALQCREDDHEIRALLEAVNHADTFHAITAERAMLRVLDGSCRTPIGGHAAREGDRFRLRGILLSDDGQTLWQAEDSAAPEDMAALGEAVGHAIKAQAGR